MNRAERRKQAKADRKAITELPEWRKMQIQAAVTMMGRLIKNGITPKDLEDEYKRGYHDATRDYVEEKLDYQQKFFFCAAALVAKRQLGFGKTRILRFLEAVQQAINEEITTADIIKRCKEETGVDVFEEEYTI